MSEDQVGDEVVESGTERPIDRPTPPARASSTLSVGVASSRQKPSVIVRPIGGASLGVALAAVGLAAGILLLRAGSTSVSPAPAAPGAGMASTAASPRAAVELSTADLPGPIYDLAFDQARDSLWYACMSSDGPDALYQFDIASGKTVHWPLPPTDHNGFLERVAVAPDGSVWVTEDYNVVRVDPGSGSVITHAFPMTDPDATTTALDQNNGSPGTWPSAITFDSQGMTLVARHNVKSLVRLDSSLAVIGRIQLPAAMVGPGDLIDTGGVVYAAPYLGDGPGVLFSEQGVLIGRTEQPVGRFSVSGTAVAAIGPAGGLRRVSSDATTEPWQMGVDGAPKDRLVVAAGGAALYEDGPGTIEWISPSGGVEGRLSLAAVPLQVEDPKGEVVTVLDRHEVGAIAVDGTGSVWYADVTSRQLVHVGL